MSNAWISSKSFTRGASQAIQVTQVAFDRFWDSWWWVFVKGFHFGEFALLFWLLQARLPKAFPLTNRESVSWSLAIAAIFAAVDEFHQSFISFRGGRVSDVMIDIGGAVFAMMAILWRNSRVEAKTPQAS